MKSVLLVSLAGVTILLSGCAPAPLTKAEVDGMVVCNVDYMDQVERQARREFKQIVWAHCPRATLRAI